MLVQSDACAAQSVVTESAPRSTTALLAKLVADASDALDDDREAARSLLLRATLLLRASDLRAGYPDARRPFRPVLAPWQMRRVIDHIEANLDTSLPLRELASIVRLSPSYFSRAFKGASGQAPHAFILSRRIARARLEMLKGVEPLAQIALACGFADQAHLARVFRRSAGLTPAVWRRVNQSSTPTGAQVAAKARWKAGSDV
jgi:AraC family transcriptional regulator